MLTYSGAIAPDRIRRHAKTIGSIDSKALYDIPEERRDPSGSINGILRRPIRKQMMKEERKGIRCSARKERTVMVVVFGARRTSKRTRRAKRGVRMKASLRSQEDEGNRGR